MKCQFGCSGFGLSLCCPPRTPTPDEMRKILDSYSHGILLHRQIKKGSNVNARLSETAVDVEQALFLDGYYKAWTLGCGPCGRCKVCTMEACVHPDKARPSMEACGVDVFAYSAGIQASYPSGERAHGREKLIRTRARGVRRSS